MAIGLEGEFRDQEAWGVHRCPVSRALKTIGPASSVLVLREVFLGTSRFEDFVRRLGMTESAVTARLQQLVKVGLLTTEPYKEPGQRTRNAYRLTQMGRDLLPFLIGLVEWADAYLPLEDGHGLSLIHAGCGQPVSARVRCADGHEVEADDLIMRPARIDSETAPVSG